ncbi:MAG: hypothetical protein QME76_04575 [Bacillota bacterium]|nr:hypothetical protein [Bacillota bacterium]
MSRRAWSTCSLVPGVLVMIILLVISAGCGSRPAPRDGAPPRPLPPGPLGEAWLDIQSALKIDPQKAYTRKLSFTLLPGGKGEIRSLNIQFVIPGSEKATVFTVRREPGQKTYDTGAQPYPRRLDLQAFVPVEDLVREIDRIGPAALTLEAGEFTAVDLVVTAEEGRLFGRDPYHEIYLAGSKGTRRIEEPDPVAVDGRAVVLQAEAVGAKPATDKGRHYVLAALCGTVTEGVRIEPPPAASGGEWLDTRWADLDGDGARETVYLLGTRSQPELPFPDRKSLLVGGNGPRMNVPGQGGYYGSSLRLRDLTGDGRPELLFFEHIGGSGAIVNLNVYSLQGDRLRTLFRAEDHCEVPGMHREYLGDSRVRAAIDPLGLVWEYEVAYSNYRNNPELTEQQIKEGYGTNWLDPFSDYDIEDTNGDGLPEIVGHQRMCGIAHVDIIGFLSQIFRWDGQRFMRDGVELYQETPEGPAFIPPQGAQKA